MMRLQRGLLRSVAACAGIGAGGDASVFGLILGFVFGAAAGEAVACCVESGAGGLAATPGAAAGGVASGLVVVPDEACESTVVFSDGGGATACFGAGEAGVGSIDA